MKKRQQYLQQSINGRFFCSLVNCLSTAFFIASACVFLMSAKGFAEEYEPTGPPPTPPLQRIMGQIDLTSEQQSALQPIIETDLEKHRAIFEKFRPGSDESKEGIRSELESIDKETETQLAEVLTNDQMEQYSKLRAELGNNMANMRPPLPPLVQVIGQLNLTQEQRDKLQPIIEADMNTHRAIMEKVRSEIYEGNDAMRDELEAIDKETETQIATVISADQMSRYFELRNELKNKMSAMKERHGGSSGRGFMQQER
jgi:Spy/CpxP family protein refolding chaperone